MKEILFFAYAALGEGLSGGDRIFIEFAKRWSKNNRVVVFVWSEGFNICKKQGLTFCKVEFQVKSMEPWRRLGFVVNYLARIIQGIVTGLRLKLKNDSQTILYSASEFWMDTFPAVILKWRYPKTIWVAAWYQTAPNPLTGFSSGSRKEKYRFKALLYWLVQLPIKLLISQFADYVLVNNLDEIQQYSKLHTQGKVLVCIGAVDLDLVNAYQTKKGQRKTKSYDGVFQGRFHPQKGVLELVDIWKKVVLRRPKAKLAMIGDGPLMSKVIEKIKQYGIEKNVKLFGYLFDGNEKYNVFSSSKIVLHPAFYDSGGMAAAEAMVFGIPGVCFDLKSLRSYYPQGMVKARVEDLDDFASKTLRLLDDHKYYQTKAVESQRMIRRHWGWNERAQQIFKLITQHD